MAKGLAEVLRTWMILWETAFAPSAEGFAPLSMSKLFVLVCQDIKISESQDLKICELAFMRRDLRAQQRVYQSESYSGREHSADCAECIAAVKAPRP